MIDKETKHGRYSFGICYSYIRKRLNRATQLFVFNKSRAIIINERTMNRFLFYLIKKYFIYFISGVYTIEEAGKGNHHTVSNVKRQFLFRCQ
jgi:hypothetical protein